MTKSVMKTKSDSKVHVLTHYASLFLISVILIGIHANSVLTIKQKKQALLPGGRTFS